MRCYHTHCKICRDYKKPEDTGIFMPLKPWHWYWIVAIIGSLLFGNGVASYFHQDSLCYIIIGITLLILISTKAMFDYLDGGKRDRHE